MKDENIALVLPAFNEESGIERALRNVKSGINLFPQYNFTLFTVDDGSSDNTSEAIAHWSEFLDLNLSPSRNDVNIGIAQTLKKTYREVVQTDNDFIIKTDLDSDFDQRIVLERLVPYVLSDEQIVAGVRWREITIEENAYEVERRKDVLRILREELNVRKLDPPSIGSQFYRKEHLIYLLNDPMVGSYDKRWGFELLLDLVSAKLGFVAPVVQIEKGNYDPLRRPREKVDAQYNSYIEIIADLKGKLPQELSSLYNNNLLKSKPIKTNSQYYL